MHNNEAEDTHGAHLALHGKQGQQSVSEAACFPKVSETRCSTLCAFLGAVSPPLRVDSKSSNDSG